MVRLLTTVVVLMLSSETAKNCLECADVVFFLACVASVPVRTKSEN